MPLPPSSEPPSDDKRLWCGVAAAVAAIAIAVVLIERWRASQRSDEGTSISRGFAITTPVRPVQGSGLIPPEPEPAANASGEMAYDEFMTMLEGVGSDPLAKEFASELMKQPALREIVKKYGAPGVAKRPGTMREFYQALAEMPEFRQLVARFRGKPGAEGLLARLQEMIPGFREMLRGEVAAARSGVTRPGAGPGSARAALRSRTGGSLDLRDMAGGASGSGALASAAGAASGPGASGAAGAQGIAGGGIAQPDGGGPRPNIKDQAGNGDAFATTPLAGLEGAGPGVTSNNFMSLCIKQASISHAECERINSHLGPHGIWASCWLANLYDKCVMLCSSVPELRCSGAPGWIGACMEVAPSEPDRDLTCWQKCTDEGRSACGPNPAPSPGPAPASPGTTTYTIRPGDNLTTIVMRVYGITDPRTAYLTALELYRYGENRKASGSNPYNPNLIFPGKVLELPPLPELNEMRIS